MPEIMSAAASELANANVTVLNGADGMSQLLAGLAGQAGQLLKLVQNGVTGTDVASAEISRREEAE
jgi:hypothetical protein